MNIEERKIIVDWLIRPLDEEEAKLVKDSKQYWAACTLAQNLVSNPSKQLEGLKVICRGPAEDGLVDARILTFLLFTGAGGDPYEFGDHGAEYIGEELESHTFSATDVIKAIIDRPLNHIESAELVEDIRSLVEKASEEAPDIQPAVYRSLYVVVHELQRATRQQRPHVIWQTWCEVFQSLCWRKGFGKDVALVSYLLISAIFDPSELTCFKMWPEGLTKRTPN